MRRQRCIAMKSFQILKTSKLKVLVVCKLRQQIYLGHYTANIYHPAIVKLQPKADKVKEKIYNLMIKGI